MREEEYWILVSKKITGEATPAELALLEKLIYGNIERETILDNLQELWNSTPLIENNVNNQELQDQYLTHINRLKTQVQDFKENSPIHQQHFETAYSKAPKKRFYSKWGTYVVAVLAIAGITLLYPLINTTPKDKETAFVKPVNVVAIKPGLRTTIQLPDGSHVWVNSGSKLTYSGDFKGSTREVSLDGEAYFDVVKDASHPFIVHTSGIDIKVLGTAFDVKAYKADSTIEATLVHGSIEVVNKNQPGSPKVMLKPHEKLIYNKYLVDNEKDQRADIKNVLPDAYSITIIPLKKNIADSDIVETAWVYNKFVFEDERFEDLAVKMERWYNVKIKMENEKLKNYKLSGTFVDETVEEALRELQILVPFSFTMANNEIKILKK